MKVSIQILVENTTPAPFLIGEYGFSALVKIDDKSYLFDTGSADALFKNSKVLGLNIDEISEIILSHGHFDHTAGLMNLLSILARKIHCHPGVFVKRYLVIGDFKKEIGVQNCYAELKDSGAEFNWIENFTEISPQIYLSGEIPRNNKFEDVGGNFKAEVDGELVEDLLPDDLSMVIDHPEGLIIISGCAHAGIVNTLEYIMEKTGKSKIKAFIGGTHLMSANEERLTYTIDYLKRINIEQIYPCHCTGFNASSRLLQELGSKVIKAETGMFISF